MTHPANDEWMTLLYGEATSEQRTALESHVAACEPCRARYAEWQAARSMMSAWKLPAQKTRRGVPRVAWAAAAMFIALAALGTFRLWALQTEVRSLRAEVRQQGIPEMRRIMANFAQEQEQKRKLDRQAIFAALDKIGSTDAENYALLRKELETVAILTEAGFRHAHDEISNIAYSPTANSETKE